MCKKIEQFVTMQDDNNKDNKLTLPAINVKSVTETISFF